jgi:hypothetical protein
MLRKRTNYTINVKQTNMTSQNQLEQTMLCEQAASPCLPFQLKNHPLPDGNENQIVHIRRARGAPPQQHDLLVSEAHGHTQSLALDPLLPDSKK